jgi:hypothetical protein
MTAKTLTALAALVLVSSNALAGPKLKASACMFEIEAEAYRFARVNRELSVLPKSDPRVPKLVNQAKAATQELFLNLHEARAGLEKLGMKARYDTLSDKVSAYVAEAVATGNDANRTALTAKQAELTKYADETRLQIAERAKLPALAGLATIGGAKVQLERITFLYEFCETECAQSLPGGVAALQASINQMNTTLPRYFKRENFELATNQAIFLKLAVTRRVNTGKFDANSQNEVIVSAKYLWDLIDEVLDAYTEAATE